MAKAYGRVFAIIMCLIALLGPAVLRRANAQAGAYAIEAGDPLATWTPCEGGFTSSHLFCAIYAQDKFLVAGDKGALFTSVDGSTWSVLRAFGENFIFRGVAYDGKRYVLVGAQWSSGTGCIFWSDDTLTWHPAYQPKNPPARFEAVVYGAGRFVAAGLGGIIWYSIDGSEWVRANSSVADDLLAIAFADGKFVATGMNGCVVTSTDGVTWTDRSIKGATFEEGVAYFANTWFVSAGFDVWTSLDTITWKEEAARPSSGTHGLFVTGEGRLLAPGAARICIAQDANHWEAVPLGQNQEITFWAVTEGNGVFVTVGAGQIYRAGQPLRPIFTTAPAAVAPQPGNSATLSASATGAPAFQWCRNGSNLAGATGASLTLADVQPASTGIYTAVATTPGASTTSAGAIVGVSTATKITGLGTEVQHDVYVEFNHNTFDQVLLEGPAVAVTSDYAEGQITRTSFVDLTDDIVQVEFSGPGTLSLVLDNPSGPAAPVNYNQKAVSYMKGHVGIVITGADERSNVSVFSVGRKTAANPALFKDDVNYNGMADLAFIAISTTNGRFGGVRTANASYYASKGFAGVYAPGVAFQGPVYIGNITAFDSATPVIQLGSADDVRITGGDLWQNNGAPVQVSGITQLKFTAGMDSHGNGQPAKTNRAVLMQNGVDVTVSTVVNP